MEGTRAESLPGHAVILPATAGGGRWYADLSGYLLYRLLFPLMVGCKHTLWLVGIACGIVSIGLQGANEVADAVVDTDSTIGNQ